MMEEFGPDYQQILTLSMPAVEYVAPIEKSPDLAKLANDGMAEIVAKHPKKFPAFVASVPMNNVPATLTEITRAVEKLGAKGIQIFTNVNGRPLDDPEFAPIFELLHSYDLPIWMHPTRPQKFADYPGEKGSKYDIWWVFGWPYETSAAMARMVFSGYFDKWPKLQIITHHLGAMVPFLEARVGLGLDQLGSREGAEESYAKIIEGMKKKGRRPVDYFRMFYADTAINGSASGTRCGLDFFGREHVLFGTDCPFDPQGGPLFIRDIIKVLDEIDVSEDERRQIYHLNAERMLKLKPR
jgi:aminocarboxymuconate-semialdehyde decarboxylase